jgi:hypothetical protein
VELMAAAGINHHDKINRHQVYRRISMNRSKRYSEIFPYLEVGCLLDEKTVPEKWLLDWREATADTFMSSIV